MDYHCYETVTDIQGNHWMIKKSMLLYYTLKFSCIFCEQLTECILS